MGSVRRSDLRRVTHYKYRAFLSYSHSDESTARWLQRRLETYRVPKRLAQAKGLTTGRLAPIFRDREELASSSDLSSEIENALTSSESLIVICSPAAARSRWVNEEIVRFRSLGRSERVFCFLIGDPEVSFPDALNQELPVLVSQSLPPAEPLAADARKHGDGRRVATLKVIAGLLNIAYDEIRQRDAVRRQKRLLVVAFTALIGMTLAVGLASWALIAERDAQQARVRAELEAAQAKEVTEFLTDLFRAATPAEARGTKVTADDLLRRGNERIHALSNQPIVWVRLNRTIGDAYWRLGNLEQAESTARETLETSTAVLGDTHEETIRSKLTLAHILYERGALQEAQSLYEQALATAENHLGSNDPVTLLATNSLAIFYQLELEQTDKAEKLFKKALTASRTTTGAESLQTLDLQLNIASVYDDAGRVDEARTLFQDTISQLRATVGADHPTTISGMENLAILEAHQERFAVAERLFSEVLDLRERVFGPRHPETSQAVNNMGFFYLQSRRYDDAEPLLRRSYELDIDSYGRSHPSTLSTGSNLAAAWTMLRRFDAAERLFKNILEIQIADLGSDDPDTLVTQISLAQSVFAQGREAEALDYIDAATASPSYSRSVLADRADTFSDEFMSFMAKRRAMKAPIR